MIKMKTQLVVFTFIFVVLVFSAPGDAEVLITEAPTHVGFAASYNSDRTMLIDFRCEGAWLSSIIKEFSEENVDLLGLESLPHNKDNSYKCYKLIISNLPQETNVVRKEVISTISKKFNLDLKYTNRIVSGFEFDFESHTIPLKKTEKQISQILGIKKDKFIGYSFEDFRKLLRSNIRKPFEFRNAPQGFYTFELDDKFTDLQSLLSWARKHHVKIKHISSTIRFLVIENRANDWID